MTHTLHLGDCRVVMATLDDNSIDAIVCDPPYELGFMGKAWDNTGIAYDVTVWQQCLRVLKPGGHLIAFGGSRTYHRLAVAIEDAGFEIRDQIQWIYGSGFPKSLDVSKAMDKENGDNQLNRRLRFTEWVRSTGLTTSQIDKATGTFMGSHYTTSASQPAIMTRAHLDAVRHLIGTVPDWIEAEVDIRNTESEAWKSRPVVTKTGEDMFGEYEVDDVQEMVNTKISRVGIPLRISAKHNVTITAPSTDLAKQWQGWGTALKPAHEPAVLARKPLCGTVADNVMTWGVGGLNIDGTRIDSSDAQWTRHGIADSGMWSSKKRIYQENTTAGRWPANVILDEDAATALDMQSGHSVSSNNVRHQQESYSVARGKFAPFIGGGYLDSGGASRFFYTAKASKAEREAGLYYEEWHVIAERDKNGNILTSDWRDDPRSASGGYENKPTQPRANHHPTVKPLSLMRYLVRLVTPKGGKVLDPFMGSGSTGCASILEGMDFIGIDITPEYVAIAQKRIDHYAVTSPLEGF